MELIRSLQNPKVKRLVRMRTKAPYRKETALIWVEGLQEVRLALQNGFTIEELYYDPEVLSETHAEVFSQKAGAAFLVSAEVMKKISYRGHTEGLIGLFAQKREDYHRIKFSKNPLIVALEAVEKPGNLGAVLRTADAAGVDAVFLCDPHTDIFHPNVVRASVGACFTVPIFQDSSNNVIAFLKEQNIQILAAALQNAIPYHQADLSKPTALVFGTESTGLTEIWRNASDETIYIPMQGKLDSLNVSNSAAILTYEAVRQRIV